MLAKRAINEHQYPKRTTSLRAKLPINRQPQLPDELLIRALSFLKLKDLLKCRRVCRRFANIIRDSLALQYRIELAHAALEESHYATSGGTSDTTIQRLDALRKQQFGWRNLAWRDRRIIPLELLKGAFYEIGSGMLLSGKRRRPGMSRSRGGLLQELPSINSKPQLIEMEFEVDVTQVTFDLEQDLLVLMEEYRPPTHTIGSKPTTFRIHLRSLSSNVLHPRAATGLLEYTADSVWTSYSFVAQIMGNNLGILFSSGVLGDSDYERIVIWDWVTGEKRGMVFMPNSRYDSFTFIAPDAFLLPCARTETINIFQFRPTPPAGVVDRGASIHHLCALKLPTLIPGSGWKYITITAQSRPIPQPSGAVDSPTALPRPKSFFMHDNTDGIVELIVTISQGIRTVDLVIVIHRRALTSFVTLNQDDLGDPLTNPWESYPMMPAKTWGPDIIFPIWRAISRCMISPCSNTANIRQKSSVYGHRLVQIVPSSVREGHLRILDFNPLFVKRPPLFPEDYHPVIHSTVTRRIISDVGVIPKGDIFVDDILSGLPYYEVTTKGTFTLAGVLMDNERIIGMKTGSPGNPDIVALDVFII